MCLLLSLAASQAKAQNKLEIYSDTLIVNPGDQYHMFFKSYSDTIMNYLKDNPRIAVDFESEDQSVIYSGGPYFQSRATGAVKMKAIIYQESRIKDYPDWNNKLDSITFVVKAPEEKFYASLPEVTMDWGVDKQTAIDATKAKYALFSDTYYAMHPSITTQEQKYFDWFTTGDNEYPLVALGYNDDGQLYSANIVVNDANRLGYMKESEISADLEDMGFQLLGWDDNGLLIMYRDADKTQASAMYLTMQGQYFRDLNFQYTPDKPTGISSVRPSRPSATFMRNGTSLTVEAGDDAGQAAVVYSLSGSVIYRTVLKAGSNIMQLGTGMPVIVRVGKHQAVKVI